MALTSASSVESQLIRRPNGRFGVCSPVAVILRIIRSLEGGQLSFGVRRRAHPMQHERFQFSLSTLLKGFFVAAVLLAGLVAYRSFFGSHRIGVSAATANRMLWSGYRLPDSATDVTYIVDFGGCEADFAISESQFLAWCKHSGWTASKIKTPVPFFEPILLVGDSTLVTDGYTFQIPNGQGVFDAKRRRTAFWASTFP